MNINDFLICIIIALAVSPISFTITKTKIFKPIRSWAFSKNKFLGELLECPYCSSHWISLLFCIIIVPQPIKSAFIIMNIIISTFVVVFFSSVFNFVIWWSYERMDIYNEI